MKEERGRLGERRESQNRKHTDLNLTFPLLAALIHSPILARSVLGTHLGRALKCSLEVSFQVDTKVLLDSSL